MANAKTKPVTAPAQADEQNTQAAGAADDTQAGGEQDTQAAGAAEEGGSTELTEGVRARRGLTMKQLVPDQDWIMKNVVAGGKGTRAVIGRIFGIVTKFERKQNEFQGTMIDSIVCNGVFNSESFISGELSEASSVFFPMAYAEKIAAVMEADPTIKVVEVDCDIGLEATGKTIPYEWVVTAYREGKEMALLKRIRGARQRPTNILVAADGTPKSLPAPTK